jgi:hypothetical protein
LASAAIAEQNGPRSVLVLSGERAELPAIVAVKSGLDAALTSDKNVKVFSEFLDFARFPAQARREEGKGGMARDWRAEAFALPIFGILRPNRSSRSPITDLPITDLPAMGPKPNSFQQ